MAVHKSAIKKHRRDETRRMINKMVRTKMRTKIKGFRAKIEAGELEEAQKMFPEVLSVIDKTVSKGTIHSSTGSRYKSRLSLLLKKSTAKT